MGAPDLIKHLTGLGLRLTRRGDKIIASPRDAVTPDLIDLIRTHKPELLAALGTGCEPTKPTKAPSVRFVSAPGRHISEIERTECSDGLPLPLAAEARRGRVLTMLRDNPGARYAVLTDAEGDREAVIVTLAIRGRATCELHIPKAKYDGTLLLDLIECHCATIH